MDLWYGFACHGIDLLAKNGVLCFIAQNNWTTSTGAKKMRNKIMTDTCIIQIVDFNTYVIFENADIQTMIMIFGKNHTKDNYIFDYRLLEEKALREDMLALLHKSKAKTKYLTPKIIRKNFKDKPITFSENDSIFYNIAKDKSCLSANEIAQGIVFPQDILDKKGASKLGNLYPVGTGIFGLSRSELEKLNLPLKEFNLIKPYFSTDQIGLYYTSPNNTRWIIYTNSSFKNENSLNEYPIIKKHLDKFRSIFTSDNKPYGLHRCRKEMFFKGEKIISLRKCVERPCFSYSDFDCYVSQTFFIIQTFRWNMKFLTGVLNSKLIAFWLRNKGKMQGNNYQVDKGPLMSIPLPSPENTNQVPIITLVDKILNIKRKKSDADISLIENQINEIVYKIYKLTDYEIRIVENN